MHMDLIIDYTLADWIRRTDLVMQVIALTCARGSRWSQLAASPRRIAWRQQAMMCCLGIFRSSYYRSIYIVGLRWVIRRRIGLGLGETNRVGLGLGVQIDSRVQEDMVQAYRPSNRPTWFGRPICGSVRPPILPVVLELSKCRFHWRASFFAKFTK